MQIKNLFVFLSIFLSAIFLSGCATAPMASLAHDSAAKEFKPQPDKSNLYIFRNETMGAVFPMTVVVNGKTLGQTASHTYFLLNVAPGKYKIESIAEDISTLDLTLEPAKNYYVWQEVKMGMWAPRSSLQQVGDDAGQKGVTDSKLIASSISGDDVSPLGGSQNIDEVRQPSKKMVVQRDADRDQVFHDLDRLKELLDKGVITQSEFNDKKKSLLQKLQ